MRARIHVCFFFPHLRVWCVPSAPFLEWCLRLPNQLINIWWMTVEWMSKCGEGWRKVRARWALKLERILSTVGSLCLWVFQGRTWASENFWYPWWSCNHTAVDTEERLYWVSRLKVLGPQKAHLLQLRHKIRFHRRWAPISAEWLSMELGLPILPMWIRAGPGFQTQAYIFSLIQPSANIYGHCCASGPGLGTESQGCEDEGCPTFTDLSVVEEIDNYRSLL